MRAKWVNWRKNMVGVGQWVTFASYVLTIYLGDSKDMTRTL